MNKYIIRIKRETDIGPIVTYYVKHINDGNQRTPVISPYLKYARKFSVNEPDLIGIYDEIKNLHKDYEVDNNETILITTVKIESKNNAYDIYSKESEEY